MEFWRDSLPERVATWPEYQRRMDPEGRVWDPLLTGLLDRIDSPDVSIVDVGAGPLSAVGQRHPGKALTVVATDPLADAYNAVLDDLAIEPPVRPVSCAGERLLEHFGPEAFDIAYAINSIDHALDPLRVIENMVGVVKPGGFVALRHNRCEAMRNCYRHLHQWNFDVSDGDFVIWRGRREGRNVTRALEGRAAVISLEVRRGILLCALVKQT